MGCIAVPEQVERRDIPRVGQDSREALKGSVVGTEAVQQYDVWGIHRGALYFPYRRAGGLSPHTRPIPHPTLPDRLAWVPEAKGMSGGINVLNANNMHATYSPSRVAMTLGASALQAAPSDMALIPVEISDDPEVRIQQSESFWRRNPAFFDVFGIWNTIKSAAKVIPGISKTVEMLAPTDAGYGQLMIDQMRWQIRSRRQPDNRWWMSVNKMLVGSGLRAEAYVRAGRTGELTDPNSRSWVNYVLASDAIRQQLGMGVGAGYSTPGSVDPVASQAKTPYGALNDAARSVSFLKKLEVALVWRPVARKAYWVAHDEAIQAGKGDSQKILSEEVRAGRPGEAAFGSAWAKTIKVFRVTNPIATSHVALEVQNWFLPQTQPIDTGSPSWTQRMFVRFIERFDKDFAEVKRRAVAGA